MRNALIASLLSWFLCLGSAVADMAQTPLLTQSSAAEPNLVFVFDDSGSMASSYMYQYGTSYSGYGMASPGGNYAPKSPDVNLMYYDPRIRYKLRINANGSEMDPASPDAVTSFSVYFYKPGVETLQVDSVSVTNGGKKYPTSGVTMSFSAPPSGGVRAEGTVTVNSNKQITAINVTNHGSGYVAVPTITLANKGSGSGFKYKVIMGVDPASTVVNRKWDGTGTPSALADYFTSGTPAGYLPDEASPLAPGATSIRYPNTASSSVTQYPKFAARTDCAGNVCTWEEEKQNYANWKLYHSTRVELARTGIGLAFQPLTSTFRLGWGTINWLESKKVLHAGVSLFTTERKQAFYDWLYGSSTNATGDTPNRLAMHYVGRYFSRSDSNGPWGSMPDFESTSTDPSTTGGTEPKSDHATCRRSNMLLMTDGYWNGAAPNPTLGNVDKTTGPSITSVTGSTYQYTPAYPYKDETSNTLADVAMKYWVNDLRTDLTNNIPAISGINEAFWQNVSFYGIGLGIYGTLPQTQATLASLASGDILWPVATADSPSAIDDMWHAAINSRGQFLNAADSDSLSEAIEKMMTAINKLSSSQSGVAVSTANLVDGTRKYTPQYTTGSWVGNVTARNLNPVTGNEVSTAWQVESVDAVSGDPLSTLPDPNDRNIVVGTGSTTSPKAVEFKLAAMTTAGLTSRMTGTVDAALIDYLRGSAAEEGDFGRFRTREARLGDIVNSSPMLVKKGVDLQYDKLPSGVPGASSYREFVLGNSTNLEGVLFVGANDGMLHAFRDGTTSTPDDAGTEIFAYVPYAVLPQLHLLADKAYAHRYYVDGPLMETASYDGTQWRNLLLGTSGAGPKSIFALNVTDPLAMTADSVLWEITPARTGFAQLGHILTDLQAGLLPSGDWVAIFGNGYMSANGSARLYVVNLNTGALLKEIVAENGPGNGLGGVRIVRNNYQQVVGAYAGDLKGNLWKFDLSGPAASDWKLGFEGQPLLAVGNTKPITAAPAVLLRPNPYTPNEAPTTGYLVVVGTGKFFETSDISTTDQQTAYGIWDSQPFGSAVASTGIPQTGTGNLVQQTISEAQTLSRTVVNSDLSTSVQDVTYYSVSRNAVNWATKRGWYIDLPHTGERVVYPLEGLLGRYIAVDAISPSNVSSNVCAQSGQGTGYVYIIDGLTGAGPGEQVLDTNGDGTINSEDAMVSGFTARADGRNTWLKVNALSDATQTVYTGITGGDGSGITVKLSCTLMGNCQPAPITGVRSREWRQLFMR
ncbi:pilus assembly protein [Candidatus Symbiobacter mobilis]|uniref:Type IV pilus assembly protein PilY1 n=1 Tax=Candidatus Symbiobacter mobilis CR TaxID=946483 RepID=U5NAA0_9BURK|nr:PilC/PilY family type IV pilus protein [Candidatus Symbiobacter mobilis]AGX87178.1 type IV pilus assembly protein PilY1 [Candidatus Symbiobacter mobilis CR]